MKPILAGRFVSWLRLTKKAQTTSDVANVPCGTCTACCRSSYFIHIRPDETKTLARIPKKFLFAAPGLPKGNVLMGYDEQGSCPMFIDNQCSIYEDRPQTCRKYDCRIFPATGMNVGKDKPLISKQAKRWKFDVETENERKKMGALQAAAKFLQKNEKNFPEGIVPANTTQQAMLAIQVHEVFLNSVKVKSNQELVDAVMKRTNTLTP